MRFLVAIDKLSSGKLIEAVTRELYLAIFNRHEEFGSIDFVNTANRANIPASMIEKKSYGNQSTDEIKNKLRENINEALAQSAPTIIVHSPSGPHLLWGCDRIELLSYLLNEKYEGPLLNHSKF